MNGLRPCYYNDGAFTEVFRKKNYHWGATDYSANGYRLPTEAEYQYADLAGAETMFSWGNHRDPDYFPEFGHNVGPKSMRGTVQFQISNNCRGNKYGLRSMHTRLGGSSFTIIDGYCGLDDVTDTLNPLGLSEEAAYEAQEYAVIGHVRAAHNARAKEYLHSDSMSVIAPHTFVVAGHPWNRQFGAYIRFIHYGGFLRLVQSGPDRPKTAVKSDNGDFPFLLDSRFRKADYADPPKGHAVTVKRGEVLNGVVKMAKIPSGTFKMGGKRTQHQLVGNWGNETPVRDISVRGFYMRPVRMK